MKNEAKAFAEMAGHGAKQFPGAVGRAVVHDDDFEIAGEFVERVPRAQDHARDGPAVVVTREKQEMDGPGNDGSARG
ncbi:MAG: hypothetical protein M5R36_25015 [Deltaproteobacteria bacterium]|nr:hypothetical protein [Deltaproteobacteria bacterium]